MPKLEIIAFDADDTLWHNERLYVDAQNRFAQLLSNYHKPGWVNERLYLTESRNIQHFGYGVKAFALSMIETAVELTEGRIFGKDIQTLVDLAREMLSADVELLEYVADTIPLLAVDYRLIVITKGDLLDQETKVDRSGLGHYFQNIEVVSHKSSDSYMQIYRRHSLSPEGILMVGNSLRSDIVPILELNGNAVYIPYERTWLHEAAELPKDGQPGFYQIENMGKLPPLLNRIKLDGTNNYG